MERFRSIAKEVKICSVSFWKDKASVEAWKKFPQHKAAQQQGKKYLFSKYRIRTAKVLHELNLNYDDYRHYCFSGSPTKIFRVCLFQDQGCLAAF